MPKRRPWWGTEKDHTTRQDAAARPESDDAPRTPGRKDTRSWCKGKVGREHTLAIEVPPNHQAVELACGWRVQHYLDNRNPYLDNQNPWHYYRCRHVEMCTTCGKVFRTNFFWRNEGPLYDEECPLFTPREVQSPTD